MRLPTSFLLTLALTSCLTDPNYLSTVSVVRHQGQNFLWAGTYNELVSVGIRQYSGCGNSGFYLQNTYNRIPSSLVFQVLDDDLAFLYGAWIIHPVPVDKNLLSLGSINNTEVLREYFQVISFQGRVLLFGGTPLPNQGAAVNDIWQTSDFLKWERICSRPPWDDSRGLALATVKNRVFAYRYDGDSHWDPKTKRTSYLDQGAVWGSDDGKIWEELARFPPHQLGEGFFALKDKLFLLTRGDSSSGHSRDFQLFSSDEGRTWAEVDFPFRKVDLPTPYLVVKGVLYHCANYKKEMFRSRDGVTWESLGLVPKDISYQMTAYGDKIYAGSMADKPSQVFSTLDGQSWVSLEGGAILVNSSATPVLAH